MKLSKGMPFALLLASASPGSFAAEVTFNGFLSAGVGVAQIEDNEQVIESLERNAAYFGLTEINDLRLSQYFGYEESVSFDSESVFGLQVNAELDDKISLTGQFVGRGTEDYQTQIEWAFLTYRLNDSLTTRIGRLRLPFYMYSDFIEVGFAYPWIAPPRESYTLSPFTGFDGIDIIHTGSIGDEWYSLFQAYWGNNNDEEFVPAFNDSFSFDIKNMMGAIWTVSNDYLSFRIGYHYQDEFNATNSGLEALVSGIREFAELFEGDGTAFDYVADSYRAFGDTVEVKDEQVQVFTAGLELDWENFILIMEAISFRPDINAFRETTTGYMTMGYRIGGTLLVHYTYEQIDIESNISTYLEMVNLDSGQIPANIQAFIDQANEQLILNVADGAKRSSHRVGVRYDVSANVAVKAEMQFNQSDIRIYEGFGSRFVDNIDSELYTIGIDLVF